MRSPSGAWVGVLPGSNLDVPFVEWRGRDTPIVLLHGLGGNALWWSGLARGLSGRRSISLDLPDHSPAPPPASWELAPMAREIVTLVAPRWPQGQIWVG